MQAPNYERLTEYHTEDGSEDYRENDQAGVIANHMGEEVFEDAPEEIKAGDDVVEVLMGLEHHNNAPEASFIEETNVEGCSRFGCRVPAGFVEVVQCGNPSCDRKMHVECYKTWCRRNQVALLAKEKIACTKRCYTRVKKLLVQEVIDANSAISLPWDKDGKDGEDDPVNSMAVLLEWWTAGNNYSRYRGKDSKGTKKRTCILNLLPG